MDILNKVKRKLFITLLNRFNSKFNGYADFEYFAIRGFPKSGTNWLSNIVNLHPQIFSSGEFGLNRFAETKQYINNDITWSVCNSVQLKQSFDNYFEEFIKKTLVTYSGIETDLKNIKQIGDKTPSNAYPPTIKNSKCLYIIRDVRDVTVSRAYHLLRVNGVWGLKKFPKMMEMMRKHGEDLEYFKKNPSELLTDIDWVLDNVRGWAKAVNQVLDAESNGLSNKYPEYKVKTVYYEDLHMNVELERKKCYEFLGLNAAIANPLDSGKIKTTPGFDAEQPQQFYRKGEVGDWKNYFSEELHNLVLSEVGDVMAKAGYIE